jgi:hypothetical protein
MNKKKEEPILKCPHCDEYIIIEKLNCGIFRHGQLISNGKQIEPHAPKNICDYYILNNLIYGCGKPFRILLIDNKFVIEICDYI